MLLQDDGNVCLYSAGGAFSGWATDTGGSSDVKLKVSDTGVLVVLSGEQVNLLLAHLLLAKVTGC